VTIVNLTGGTAKWLVVAEWRGRHSSARYMGDLVKWNKVLRHESMQDFVHQNGELVLDSLRHTIKIFRGPFGFLTPMVTAWVMWSNRRR